jgi:sterol desaturase/sphingolipid hydroxylase (fatty acid hydroxylase superfamily)
MSVQEFSRSVGLVVALMALLAVVEVALPLHRSAPAVRGRKPANLALAALVFGMNFVLSTVTALLAAVLSLKGFSMLAAFGLPLPVQVIITVVVLDGFTYLAHLLMHKLPLLWRFHQVHHADPFVDVTTSFRTHPGEAFWRFVWTIVPAAVLGLPAEGIVIYRTISVINALFEHANIRVWRPLERVLGLFWVTPDMHKFHHSRDPRKTDTNYGNILALYDRVFRTFTPSDRAAQLSYGLGESHPGTARSVRGLLELPFEAQTRRRDRGLSFSES